MEQYYFVSFLTLCTALGVGIHGDMSGVDKAAAVEQLSDLQQQINALLKQFGK